MTQDQLREQWLKERKSHIGASEVAAILGASPYRGPLDVYLEKTSEEVSEADNDYMKFGRDVEGAIANLYATRTGRPVVDLGATRIQKHKEYPYIGATLDRATARDDGDPLVPLELKHVSRFDVGPEQWEQEPPLYYQIQLMIQMFCTGNEWGSLAGMFPGYQLAYKDIEYSSQFMEVALPVLEDFWQCVENRTPPEVDEHRGALDAMKQIWAKEEQGKLILLPSEASQLVEEWKDAKARKKAAEQDARHTEALLRELMTDAEVGELPDGSKLTLKSTTRKAYTKEVPESTYRTLRHTKRK